MNATLLAAAAAAKQSKVVAEQGEICDTCADADPEFRASVVQLVWSAAQQGRLMILHSPGAGCS